MVIQRIQSLLLLLAVICTVVFIFTPFAYGPESVKPLAYPALWIVLTVSAALSLADIFLFKNTGLQKKVLIVAALLIVAAIVISIVKIATEGLTLGGGGLLMIASLIALVAAYRSIRADEKLLHSLDRLR